jgi:hypothetical protein
VKSRRLSLPFTGSLEDFEHLGCLCGGCGPGASLLAKKEQRARVLDGCDGYDQTVGARDTGAIAARCLRH